MPSKVTSIDIAYRAGVSQATVSRALSGSPLVSMETRKRILALASEMKYKVDKNASGLRRQKSGTLALLLFEDPTSNNSLINPFFLSMLSSITRRASKHGYDLLVSFQQSSDDWQRDYQDTHKADGLILLGYGDYRLSRVKLASLAESGTCFVRWGSVTDDSNEGGQTGTTIGCDNTQGGRLATEHLLAQGRKNIAFIGDISEACPEFRARYQGYVAALQAAGLKANPQLQIAAVDSTEPEGQSAAQALLATKLPCDAIFAASDLMAIGAMRALQEHGLRVPGDIAVVGFDDIPIASYSNPPLSSVLQDTKKAGELLVDTLVSQIRGEIVSNQTMPAQLLIRASSMSLL
jgi:DNA-binding LacI/PurR family transcriptional regulator